MLQSYTFKLWTLRILTALIVFTLLGLMHTAFSQEPTASETADSINEPAVMSTEAAAIQTKNLLQVIRDGGPLMIPIAICSFVLMIFVFERLISLRRGRIIPRPFVKRFLEQIREGQLQP